MLMAGLADQALLMRGDTAHGLLHGVHGLPAFVFMLLLRLYGHVCLHA